MIYTDKELARHMRELTTELGHIPTQLEMSYEEGRPSLQTYLMHFGTWKQAISECLNMSREEVDSVKDHHQAQWSVIAKEVQRLRTQQKVGGN